MTFFDYLKNIFIIFIFLQIAPSMIKNIKKQYGRIISPKSRVGVINVKGVLYNSDFYNKHLNKFFKNKDIKAILVKMDCPGGASGTAQSIFNEIRSLKKQYNKPIVTLVENICASGGYYIACATDYIVAPPSAIVGSIGSAFQYLFQLKEFIEQYKIGYKSITAGKYKTTADPFVDMTPEQEKLLQAVLDNSYNQFTFDVAKNRKLSSKGKEQWAEGKILTGNQALKLGLIDKTGSAFDATEVIKEKALIEDEIEWVKPKIRTGLLGLLGGQDPQEENGSMFSTFANKICTFLENRYCSKKVV